jgi:hypothetical protein
MEMWALLILLIFPDGSTITLQKQEFYDTQRLCMTEGRWEAANIATIVTERLGTYVDYRWACKKGGFST